MNRMIVIVALSCLCVGNLRAQSAPLVTLTRLDCGNEPEPMSMASFSDTYEYEDLKIPLTYSCYLVRHGDDYMIWDAGNPVGSAGGPKASIVELLGRLQIKSEQVKYLGISHHHHDHIGQAASLAHATLLVGKGDWEVLKAEQPPERMTPGDFAAWRALLAPWISGSSKVELLSRDKKDVFGDGTVVMLSTPGHTPGHHALLVRLAQTGALLLSGDATHFRENYESNGVPTWNFNRADTLASLERLKAIARNLHATLIIQHDPRDIAKLPAFPSAAR